MNTAFVNIIKGIVNRQGEAILGDPARLKQFVHMEAQAVPAELRLAFGRCVEQGYYRVLKQALTAEERSRIKPRIARQMSNITKLDESICAEAVDVLEAVLYKKLPLVNKLPHVSKGRKKAIIALSAAAAAAIIIITAALHWGSPVFEPIG
jgi:hypothetical protein